MHEIFMEIKKDICDTVVTVLAVNGPRTWENSMVPLDRLSNRIALASKLLTFPNNVHVDAGVRDRCEIYTGDLAKLGLEQLCTPAIYAIYKEVRQNDGTLNADQIRILDDCIYSLRHLGLDLPEKEQKRMHEIVEEITKLATEFQSNLNNCETSFTFNAEELAGLPVDLLQSKRIVRDVGEDIEENLGAESKEAEQELYRLTLNTPDYVPAMEFVHNAAIREQLYTAYNRRCIETNPALLERIVSLRRESAALLGYKNYAEQALNPQMAKTPAMVYTFLNQLLTSISPAAAINRRQLLDVKRGLLQATDVSRDELDNPIELHPWDTAYLNRILVERECDLDMAALRDWFPVSQVVAGTLEIYQRLLGLRFQQRTDNIPLWHKDVTFYEVFDSKNPDRLVGAFYLDLYPREGKYKHACCCDLTQGYIDSDGMRVVPTAAMLCNFPEQTGLQFGDVKTFFHEFGHVMHHVCNETNYNDFHAFGVETDFVEAPSQMLEYWCQMPEALALLSRHITTGETIGLEMVQKLRKSATVGQALMTARQLAYGLMDMDLHTSSGSIDLAKLSIDTIDRCTGIRPPDSTNFFAGFGHMVGGYAAGYYGYQWSLVYATDMFASRFLKEGVLNPETGASYRKTILAPGCSRDGMDLIKDFLGRAPNTEAYGRLLAGTLFM
jgi:Zn-dependent oligopeptidase